MLTKDEAEKKAENIVDSHPPVVYDGWIAQRGNLIRVFSEALLSESLLVQKQVKELEQDVRFHDTKARAIDRMLGEEMQKVADKQKQIDELTKELERAYEASECIQKDSTGDTHEISDRERIRAIRGVLKQAIQKCREAGIKI